MLPDEPTEEERQEELTEDNETPFQPAPPAPVSDTAGSSSSDNTTLPDDHPATDTGIQKEELYDEGVSGAAEAAEPSEGNAVADYTPPASQKDSKDVEPEEPTNQAA